MTVVLVLGGARSGKSEVGERLAGELPGPVTYVATGAPVDAAADPSWAARVEAHRARRPDGWATVEVGASGLVAALAAVEGTALVDSLGTWVAGALDFAVDAGALCDALVARRDAGHATVVVSDEVGLGVVPSTRAGGEFRDVLGSVNRAVAAVADDAWLVVAGRRLRLEP